MNLTDLTVSGTNEISLQNSLNASLLELKVTMGANSVAPQDNDLIVYVDTASSANPTADRKQYLFELSAPLAYANSQGDELVQKFVIVDNDVDMKTVVNRKANETVTEEVECFPVTLFEGTNYIYTNYTDVNISVVYPKDTIETKSLLNVATYYAHKLKNDGEFSLDDIYFKDAFTKTGDKLNLEVNNASVDCITSNNNAFSLDSEGNLVVNTITANNSQSGDSGLAPSDVVDLIYPVGSIYMSVNTTSPATLFGGTWEQIKGRFLIGTGSNDANTTTYWGSYAAAANNFPNGELGGEATHTLSTAEMPSHNHSGTTGDGGGHSHTMPYKGFLGINSSTSGWFIGRRNVSGDGNDGWWNATNTAGNHQHSFTTGNTGSTNAHNNMPPYMAVNMWKRVS